MKLLFFIQALEGGGAERVLVTLANELQYRGYDVTVAYQFARPVHYKLDEGIKVIDLAGGKKLSKKGVWNKMLFMERMVSSIKRITYAVSPDVVISFMVGMSKFVIPTLHFTRFPIIASEHINFDDKNRGYTSFNRFSRWHLNKWADRVTILTEFDKNIIGNRLHNTVVMYNPLTFTPLTPEEYQTLEPKRKNIMACGNLDRYVHKGFDNLIKAFALIASKYPNLELDIYGGGGNDSTRYLSGLINQYGLDKQVNLKGRNNHIDEVMKSHQVFVLSSRYEGLPMVLLEAMAMGCCCVSFDCHSGPNEIIRHNVDGLLVADQDIEQLASSIEYVVTHAEERKRMAYQATVNIRRFALSEIADKWEILIHEVSKQSSLVADKQNSQRK